MNVFAVRRKTDHRVANQLTQAVICNLAAAIYLKNFDAQASEHLGGSKDAFVLRSPAESEYMRVFEKQKIVSATVFDDLVFELLLDTERVTIGNAAEPADFQQSLSHIIV
jgi:hypothetical protein